jgi:outer membrane receptor protein involved in Fe transport
MRSTLRFTIASALSATIALVAPFAQAEAKLRFDLPSQPLADSLRSLGSQANINILFDPPLIAGRMAASIDEVMTADEALTRLLQGTGIRHQFVNEATVVLTPALSTEASKEGQGKQKPSSSPGAGEAQGEAFQKKSVSDRLVIAQTDQASDGAGSRSTRARTISQDATGLEEIVVTAQKRAERLQEVPASVTAIKGDVLSQLGLGQLADYAQYAPGLAIQNGGSPGQASVTLRGIAPVGPGSVIGYYIDDTPLGASGNYAVATLFALDLMPYDMDRLEILRGPQGTLYGAGAMGGLLKYVLKQADPAGFSAQFGGDVSSAEQGGRIGYAGRAAVNVPIVADQLAVRASLYDKHYQGYTDNVFLGASNSNTGRQYGGRVALTWQPSDTLRVNLGGIWNRIDSDDNAAVTLGALTTVTDDGVGFLRGEPTLGEMAEANTFLQPFSKHIDYYSATVVWDVLEELSITSATSWSRSITHRLQDTTASYGLVPVLFDLPPGYSDYSVDLDLKKLTQELRVASAGGDRLEWLAGVFYTDETSANHQRARIFDTDYTELSTPPLSPVLLASLPSTYEEYAGFGSLTFMVTDRFDVTGGVRYAHNEQEFTQILGGLVLGTPPPVSDTASESVTTWSISSRFRWTPDTMVYGKVATGYRPGGPNAALAGAVPSVDSDTLISYELGLKSIFLDGRALLNVSVFDIDWKDIQQAIVNEACSCSFLANAGDAYSRGFELEGSFRPIAGLTIGYNAAYTRARLTELLPNVPGGLLTGYQLPTVPEWSGAVNVDYNWPLANQVTARIGAGVHYVGEKNVVAISTDGPNTRDPSYTTGDVRAGLSSGQWSVTLFVRNVTDKRVYLSQSALQSALDSSLIFGIGALPLEPRTAGLSFDVSF